MERLLQVVATVAIVSIARPLLQTRLTLRNTTLIDPWRWGMAAGGVWAATWIATDGLAIVGAGVADQLWYASAVMTLCPFVSALEARRPGARVWNLFVVLPVTIVLFLPAVTAWDSDLRPGALELEAPMLMGFGLVLLMGAGNYVGTRFAPSAIMASLACLAVVARLSPLRIALLADPLRTHAAATIVLSLSVWLGSRQARRTPVTRKTAYDAVWIDFRDLFGVVWARRVLDRINETAAIEHWPIRLHMHGFSPVVGQQPNGRRPSEDQQVERALRWNLRRFVDPAWIDERIAASEPGATGGLPASAQR